MKHIEDGLSFWWRKMYGTINNFVIIFCQL